MFINNQSNNHNNLTMFKILNINHNIKSHKYFHKSHNHSNNWNNLIIMKKLKLLMNIKKENQKENYKQKHQHSIQTTKILKKIF